MTTPPGRENASNGTPTAVGPYRIIEVLGRGGMGVVYVAEDERLGRRVALKTLGEVRSGDARDRLWREARAAASLNHPGICQVYDVEEVGDELWVAMELLEGEGLDERLDRDRFGVEEAATTCLDILAPLGFLHDRGLVHRDLKPSNIFLTPLGTKILDFGLTRPVDAIDTRLTQTAAILGTPHYMAPEQWRAQEVGPQSDLFSCGALLYEMLSGRHAFEGADAIDIFHAVAHEQPPRLTGSPGIEALDRVVRRAIAKDPLERPASASEMADELEEALERARMLETAGGVRSTPPLQRRAETIQRFIALPFRMLRPDSEIDFLTTSLPEAIGASLSDLQHLVVRSTRLAQGQNGADRDLKKLASEAEVDYALAGTLMSAGSRVRLSAELLQVPAGTVVWSLQEDFVVEDLFQLQDDLADKVVEGVAIPLSSTEAQRLHADESASPKGYELYLRALHAFADASTNAETFAVRDLLKASLEEDPNYAPAWAQYARACRWIAKYASDDPEADLQLAGQAFKRAFESNPDSAIAHQLYTYYQLEELGDSKGAMLRLLGLVRERTANAHLWAGLVPALRFSGLYRASVAAHERARALDPTISTSVIHTYFQLAEWERAIDSLSSGSDLFVALARSGQGRDAEAIELLNGSAVSGIEGLTFFRDGLLAALERRAQEVLRIVGEVETKGVRDPDTMSFIARILARVGAIEPALDTIDRALDGGWFSIAALELDPWLEPLQGHPRFEAALQRAREGRAEALVAFREAGGEKLLDIVER